VENSKHRNNPPHLMLAKTASMWSMLFSKHRSEQWQGSRIKVAADALARKTLVRKNGAKLQ
jgi:hypothetical protein